jgi:signal transduction histidine kinase
VPRSPSSILFALILCLSFALVVWWTVFQVHASGELELAGRHLVTHDIDGAAQALGAKDAASLTALARTRYWMFCSEGIVFGLILLVSGWLYAASERREAQLQKLQDHFLAGATHELKTPLATIVLLLESLRDERLPADKRSRYLATGLLEAERLERGLTNLLTAAGLRTSARHTAPQAGDLVTDVQKAIAAMEARAIAAGVTLQSELPATLPMMRDAEAVQLVLRNLLDNAIKYSPTDSAVKVTVDRHDDEARIRVQDQGRGLDDQELSNAFRPFWRGNDTASGGSGLGLHLVRELVLTHGGSVGADSKGRDQGAEFTVRLPLRGGSR